MLQLCQWYVAHGHGLEARMFHSLTLLKTEEEVDVARRFSSFEFPPQHLPPAVQEKPVKARKRILDYDSEDEQQDIPKSPSKKSAVEPCQEIHFESDHEDISVEENPAPVHLQVYSTTLEDDIVGFFVASNDPQKIAWLYERKDLDEICDSCKSCGICESCKTRKIAQEKMIKDTYLYSNHLDSWPATFEKHPKELTIVGVLNLDDPSVTFYDSYKQAVDVAKICASTGSGITARPLYNNLANNRNTATIEKLETPVVNHICSACLYPRTCSFHLKTCPEDESTKYIGSVCAQKLQACLDILKNLNNKETLKKVMEESLYIFDELK